MTARTRRRSAAVVVALLASIVGTSCDRSPSPAKRRGATSTTTSPPTTTAAAAACPSTTSTPADGESSGTLRFAGTDRTYLLHVPASYDATDPTPVVFSFHGYGSSARSQMGYADFRPLAERHGFVIVAPDGQGNPRRFSLLGATATEADDVEFAKALLDHVATQVCIDQRRVYATGMSNGGALSSAIACRAADRFAAVAAVAAVIYVPPCPGSATTDRPAPIVAMMGTADPVVPYEGGRVNCCGNPNIAAAEATLANFATRNGCDADRPVETRPQPTIVHRSYTGCDDPQAAVELYSVEGGGHTWPGATFDLESRGLGRTSKELIATDTIWAFFTAHPRPPT